MMIAQTGIEPASSTAVAPVETASTAVWWLILLAAACLVLTWYLRRLNRVASKRTGGDDTRKKSTPRTASVSSSESYSPRSSESDRVARASKSSSKKNKKKAASAQNQPSSRKQDGNQNASSPELSGVGQSKNSEPKVSTSSTAIEAATESAKAELPQATAPVPVPVPVPVAAIFEPLRRAAPPRRNPSSLSTIADKNRPQSGQEDTVQRSASGGKFERMVPSTAYTREAASRWPASMTNPVERPVATRSAEVRAETKASASLAGVTAPELPSPAMPAAKGLKSFVSKVKNAASTDVASTDPGLVDAGSAKNLADGASGSDGVE